MLPYVALCWAMLRMSLYVVLHCAMLRNVALCCTMLPYFAIFCPVLQYVAIWWCPMLLYVALYCPIFHYVVLHCPMLPYVVLSPGQTIATFQGNISQHCRTHHVALVWPLWCDVLRCVATCWMLLAQIWRWSNFSPNICGCCMMLRSFGQVNGTMLRLGMRTSSVFNSQHQSTLICPFHCCVSISLK